MISKDAVELIKSNTYVFGEFRLEAENLLLLRNSEVVPLAPKAVEVLKTLVEADGKLIAKQEILDKVWADTFVEEANLTHHISALRKALCEDKNGRKFIETIPRRGYRFVAEVEKLSEDATEIVISERVTTQIVDEVEIENNEPAEHSATMRARQLSGEKKFFTRRLIAVAAVLLAAFGAVGFAAYKYLNSATGEFYVANPTRLTLTGKIRKAAISPDGKFIAYTQRDGELRSVWVKQVANEGGTQIIAPAAVKYGGLTFSPDGNLLYYTTYQEEGSPLNLHRIPTLGGTPQKVSSNLTTDISFSPDGKRFAFLRNSPEGGQAVVTADANGTNEETIYNFNDSPASLRFSVAWSPDGQTIACVEFDGFGNFYIRTINIADKTTARLSTADFANIWMIAWMPDSKNLLAVASPDEKLIQIWQFSAADGKGRRVTDDFNNYESLSVAADGKTLVAVRTEQSAHLWTMPADDASLLKQITVGFEKTDGGKGISWTSDNRIFYQSVTSGEIIISVINADGGNPRQVASGISSSDGATSPDGRYTVYQKDSGKKDEIGLFLLDAADGSERRLTFGTDLHCAFSPDGKWIVFTRFAEEVALWKVATSGGEPVQLTHDVKTPLAPTVSPDGKFIAAISRAGETSPIIIIPFDGGESVKNLDTKINRTPLSDIRYAIQWSADGSGIYFNNSDSNGISNIWRQPVDGGAPVRITDFTTGVIFNFAFSKNDEQLALSRGTITSDVMLIKNIR